MELLFADTTFLVGVYNADDVRHKEAESFVRELAQGVHGNFRLVTTDYVFDELVTTVLARTKDHKMAARAGRAVRESRAWRLEYVGQPGFEAAWELFLERGDKRWSFTDCTSFAFMEIRGLRKAVTFDENFRQAGFAMLP